MEAGPLAGLQGPDRQKGQLLGSEWDGTKNSQWQEQSLLALWTPQPQSRLCRGHPRTLQMKRLAWGAGCNGVKKASSREHTSLDSQKSLGNWRGPGFSSSGPSGLVATHSPLRIPSAWEQGLLLDSKDSQTKKAGLRGRVGSMKWFLTIFCYTDRLMPNPIIIFT